SSSARRARALPSHGGLNHDCRKQPVSRPLRAGGHSPRIDTAQVGAAFNTMQLLPPHLLDHCDEALLAVEGLLVAARDRLHALVEQDGGILPALLDREQRAAHAFAWYATTGEALKQTARWARDLEQQNRLKDLERLI